MKNLFKKEKTIYFTPGISGNKVYRVDITRSFWSDTIFNFSKESGPLKGYENYVIGECFRCGAYKQVEIC